MDNGTTAIVTNYAVGSTELALEPELAAAVREVVGAAESPNTRRAYKAQFTKFEAWCKRRGANPLPSTPAVVAVFLVDLAKTGANQDNPKGAKVGTIGLALSAISAAHRDAGFALDTKAREIALAKATSRRLLDGTSAMRFTRLLAHMATIVRNMVRSTSARIGEATFTLTTRPNPKQQRALDLLTTIAV
jgi:hypothetical protein